MLEFLVYSIVGYGCLGIIAYNIVSPPATPQRHWACLAGAGIVAFLSLTGDLSTLPLYETEYRYMDPVRSESGTITIQYASDTYVVGLLSYMWAAILIVWLITETALLLVPGKNRIR